MLSYRTTVSRLRHPVNVALHTNAPLQARIANAVTGLMGSMEIDHPADHRCRGLGRRQRVPPLPFRSIPVHLLEPRVQHPGGLRRTFDSAASNQSAVRDRATLEHAALTFEEADKKDDDLRARLERIEALLTATTASKG